MKNTLINRELTVSYTDSFQEMNTVGLRKYFLTEKNRWGIHDTDRHMLVSVCWSDPGILNYLTDARSVAGGLQLCLRRGLDDYRKTESVKCTFASKKMKGFRFSYVADDTGVKQLGQVLVFRQRNKFYIVYYLSAAEYDMENMEIFGNMMQSIKIN